MISPSTVFPRWFPDPKFTTPTFLVSCPPCSAFPNSPTPREISPAFFKLGEYRFACARDYFFARFWIFRTFCFREHLQPFLFCIVERAFVRVWLCPRGEILTLCRVVIRRKEMHPHRVFFTQLSLAHQLK